MANPEQRDRVGELRLNNQADRQSSSRESLRSGLQIEASYSCSDGVANQANQVLLAEISAGGAVLLTETPEPVGTPVRMRLLRPQHDQDLTIEAEVSWQDTRSNQRAGMGLRFAVPLDPTVLKTFGQESEVYAPPRLCLKGAERAWGRQIALAGVDLTIEPGERVALLGPSGSGKTTILKLLMASLRPSSGVVEVDGIDMLQMSPRDIRTHRRKCALVDQGAQVIPRLSVHANVIAGRVSGWPWWKTMLSTMWSLDRDDVAELLDDVGMADRQWDRADNLSGGQRQRVSIARALAGDASVLLADEPTAALDPTTSAEVIRLLGCVTRRRNATLIISTHRVSQVLDEVDRIIGVRDGIIQLDCLPEEADDAVLNSLYAGSRERG